MRLQEDFVSFVATVFGNSRGQRGTELRHRAAEREPPFHRVDYGAR
jgi:hypothetical protein